MHLGRFAPSVSLVAFLALSACSPADDAERTTIRLEDSTDPVDDIPYWMDDTFSMEDLERGRLDTSWRDVAEVDSVAVVKLDSAIARMVRDAEAAGELESFADIGEVAADSATATAPPITLPLRGNVEGPSVLYVQVLLDHAGFSPGVIDGRWGKNTEKAVFWLQQNEGLPATGGVDSLTYTRLAELAGLADQPDAFVATHELSAEDVEGPFAPLPADVYAQGKLKCLCYASLTEKLAERFHTTPAVLAELNPGASLDALMAGDTLRAPAVSPLDGSRTAARGAEAPIAQLVISDQGHYLHALDAAGKIVYHFPATLGSQYDPSPSGDFKVVSITPNPWFHYQPALLAGADTTKPNVQLPPGPNSPVGLVWIKLSKAHYGIHGTREPAAIGYATSSGCIRLTNWDAKFLGERLSGGVPVEFRDMQNAPAAPPRSTT
ncbi:MAG: L,D-transpeptidase family protein [Gemmatimonadota bacterium]